MRRTMFLLRRNGFPFPGKVSLHSNSSRTRLYPYVLPAPMKTHSNPSVVLSPAIPMASQSIVTSVVSFRLVARLLKKAVTSTGLQLKHSHLGPSLLKRYTSVYRARMSSVVPSLNVMLSSTTRKPKNNSSLLTNSVLRLVSSIWHAWFRTRVLSRLA